MIDHVNQIAGAGSNLAKSHFRRAGHQHSDPPLQKG
jgi:hypothetical protein